MKTSKTDTHPREKKRVPRQGDLPQAILDEKRDPNRLVYMKEILGRPLPTADEETALFAELARYRAFRTGACDGEAGKKERDPNPFERTVKTIAGRYLPVVFFAADKLRERGCPLEFLDLVQEGNLALLKAVEGYDPAKTGSKTGRTARFATYASTAAWRAMERAAEADRRTRVPDSPEEEPAGDVDPDTLPAPKSSNPYERLAKKDSREWLRKEIARILETLTDREREVLVFRFGLGDGFSRTLLTVGEQFGVDEARIRQIEAKALRKLRNPDR